MKPLSVRATALVYIAMTWAVGLYANWILPAHRMVAARYDLAGRVIGYAPKELVLAIVPLVSLLVIGGLALLARFAPGRTRLARSTPVFDGVVLTLAALFFVIEIGISVKISNPALDLLRYVFFAVAALLVVVGNGLGKLRQNSLFGVRTPWTLGDERVWDKTHRFTGWAMVLSGFVLIAIDVLTPAGAWLVVATVLCAAGPPLLGVAYSARQWRREHAA